MAFFITWPYTVAMSKALALFGSIMEYIGEVATRKPPDYELQFYIDAFIKDRHWHYRLAVSLNPFRSKVVIAKYRYEEMVARMCPWSTIKTAALFVRLIDALEQQFRMHMSFSDEYAELWPKLFGDFAPPAVIFEHISKWGDGMLKRLSTHPMIGEFVTQYMDMMDRGGYLNVSELDRVQRLKQEFLDNVDVIEPPLAEFLASK
jgi:hypothetical protein